MENGLNSLKQDANTIILAVRDNNLAVWVNGKLLFTQSDIGLPGIKNAFIKTRQGGNIRIDNVKFWNLDGIELDQSGGGAIPVSTDQLFETRVNSNDGAEMVYIPAGEFQMGSEAPSLDASPIHQVHTDAFWAYQTEVTNEMYAVFLNESEEDVGDYYPTDPEGDYPIQLEGVEWRVGKEKNAPVAYVTWDSARAYCKWAGTRLLNEAEWEKAARGGLEGKLYPWGDELPVNLTTVVNGVYSFTTFGFQGKNMPVASYYPNGYGLYDMAGGVAEWTSTCFAPYPYNANDGRESYWLCDDGFVVRSSSYNTVSFEIARRMKIQAWLRNQWTGFRCGMDGP